jgi:hypothetical protein
VPKPRDGDPPAGRRRREPPGHGCPRVIYDDEVVLWLADQVERVADRPQELDAEAAIALLDHHAS